MVNINNLIIFHKKFKPCKKEVIKIAQRFFYNQTKIRDPETNKFNSIPAMSGESAYQLAVRLGTFTGTEEEYNSWLDEKRSNALKDIDNIKSESMKAVSDEGIKQVDNVSAIVDGIAQDSTAKQILEKENKSLEYLTIIATAAGKAGSLNGFGLEKGLDDSVVISYTDPETEILEGSCIFPRDTTLVKIKDSLSSINNSLKIIALRNGVTV